MSASFISERTAELILVPELLTTLKPFYPEITPLYYWVSREGGAMSRYSFAEKKVRLLVLYARRPKVTFPGSGSVQIKLNEVLFDRARFFAEYSIPVIAGFPLADKLEDLRMGVECMWLKIDAARSEEVFKVDLNSKNVSNHNINILSVSQIVHLINNAHGHSWMTTLDIIYAMRKIPTVYSRFYTYMTGDLYKPVYLLIHEDYLNKSF